jgi:hypothetical protein
MRFRNTQAWSGRPSRRMGRPPISGLPEIGINVRKSGKPDLRCSRRRARGLRNLARHKVAAPHHEAGRDRGCCRIM